VEFYFSPRHETYIRAAKVTDRIRDILKFYQELIGPSPFDDMPLKIVETSVYKPGGHSSLNVVTMAEYLLNRAKVSDPNTDARYILRDLNILAHELGHQWWGSGVAIDDAGAWSSEGLTEYIAYQYLAARCPAGITHNIPRSWRGAATQRQYAYWRKDPAALERMRPALREKLLLGLERGEAYSVLPVRLLEAEERMGKEAVRARLAEVLRQYRGRTLDRSGFVAAMGPGIIELEKEQP
jgi:aminopeptidase N